MKKNKKLYIACICFLILIVATSITKIMQNDTYFTIATGNSIIENGYDNLDHLTSHEGLKFYKLRWAFDVTIATIYNNFGFTGIYVFTLIIACTTTIILFNILLKMKTNILVAFIMTMISMMLLVLNGYFTARAQIISYLLLLVEVYLIEKVIEKPQTIYYILIFLVSVLIVNFHASIWMMTIILILPYLAEAIIGKFNKKCKNKKIIIRKINIMSLITVIGINILGSLFSPIGIYTYTYMFKVIGGISSQIISELQGTNVVMNVGIMTMLVITIAITLTTKTKIRLSDLLMFVGLFIMGVMANRNNAYFYIIGSIVVARLVTQFFNDYDNENIIEKASIKLQKNKSLSILTIFIAIIAICCYSYRMKEQYVDKTTYPVDAVKYIKENMDYKNLKIFNHLDFGSYIELSGIPAFIDSRTEIYTKEFNDTDILEEWWKTMSGSIHYDDTFKKYDIDYAILYNEEIINTYIQKDKNYEQVYKDDYFSVYVKRNGVTI